jgi:uncharacterized membrane protein
MHRLLPSSLQVLLRSRGGRLLLGLAGLLLLGTLVGLALLWPGGDRAKPASPPFGGVTYPGRVAHAGTVRCPGQAVQRCVRIAVDVEGGPAAGTRQRMTLGPVGFVSSVQAGDDVRVQASGAPAGTPGIDPYAFVDVDRHDALRLLVVLFVVLVIVLARWRGLLALIGFALSLGLVTQFLVPAILEGSSPILVALVGSLAVMFVTLILTYGIAPASLAAALGIAASLLLGLGLARLWVDLASLDGRSNELGTVLAQQNSSLSLQGIVLAGMVIGALGVLADTGVTQASAVLALRRANPALNARRVFQEAFVVGRDHLTATIHTLVLAYVGASLPLILVLSGSGISTGDAFNAQDIAEPVVATLVGSIALLASVPLTTGLAALLVARMPAEALPDDGGHGHHHH